jgi:hypothetical protein
VRHVAKLFVRSTCSNVQPATNGCAKSMELFVKIVERYFAVNISLLSAEFAMSQSAQIVRSLVPPVNGNMVRNIKLLAVSAEKKFVLNV